MRTIYRSPTIKYKHPKVSRTTSVESNSMQVPPQLPAKLPKKKTLVKMPSSSLEDWPDLPSFEEPKPMATCTAARRRSSVRFSDQVIESDTEIYKLNDVKIESQSSLVSEADNAELEMPENSDDPRLVVEIRHHTNRKINLQEIISWLGKDNDDEINVDGQDYFYSYRPLPSRMDFVATENSTKTKGQEDGSGFTRHHINIKVQANFTPITLEDVCQILEEYSGHQSNLLEELKVYKFDISFSTKFC